MNVIVIEDTHSIRTLISQTLRSYGYIPHELTSKKNIRSLLKTLPLRIVILNTSLLHINSRELCSFIREHFPEALILAIHSRGPWNGKVDILQSGADDCLSFPFPGQELLARIQSLLRRPHIVHTKQLKCGKITLNPLRKEATYNKVPIEFTKKEFQVLEYLIRNKDRAITRAELLDNVWDYKRIINSNTVDVHIRKIRMKLRESNPKSSKTKGISKTSNVNETSRRRYRQGESLINDQTEIQTVHGVGYRMDENIDQENENHELTTPKPPPEL